MQWSRATEVKRYKAADYALISKPNATLLGVFFAPIFHKLKWKSFFSVQTKDLHLSDYEQVSCSEQSLKTGHTCQVDGSSHTLINTDLP